MLPRKPTERSFHAQPGGAASTGRRRTPFAAVTLGLPRSGMTLIGRPAEKKADPRKVVDGQFSGPFVVACALATGAMGRGSCALLQDPAVRSLLPKISCALDPEIEAAFPANMSGKVTIRARGQSFVTKVVVPKGERAKFQGRADAVPGIAGTGDVAALMRLAAPVGPARLAGEQRPHGPGRSRDATHDGVPGCPEDAWRDGGRVRGAPARSAAPAAARRADD